MYLYYNSIMNNEKSLKKIRWISQIGLWLCRIGVGFWMACLAISIFVIVMERCFHHPLEDKRTEIQYKFSDKTFHLRSDSNLHNYHQKILNLENVSQSSQKVIIVFGLFTMSLTIAKTVLGYCFFLHTVKGIIVETKNAFYIQWIGLCFIIQWFFDCLINFWPRHAEAGVNITWDPITSNFPSIVIGLFIFLFGLILSEAAKIKEDQSLTI